jgi:ClpP class serine protease
VLLEKIDILSWHPSIYTTFTFYTLIMFSTIKLIGVWGSVGYTVLKLAYYLYNRKSKKESPKKDGIIHINTSVESPSYIQGLFFKNGESSIGQSTFLKFKEDINRYKSKEDEKDEDIHIVINTLGGSVFYTVLIAKLIATHTGKVTCSVKDYAMSGGSLIALMADRIILERTSLMGPIDPVMGGGFFNVKTILRLFQTKKKKNDLSIWEEYLYEIANDGIESYVPLIKDLFKMVDYNEETIEQIITKFVEESKMHANMICGDELDFLKPRLEIVEHNDILY